MNPTESERNPSLTSILKMTMKTLTTLTLAATLSLAGFIGAPAHAADFSSFNSKRGSLPHPTSSYMVAIDYGKFTWLEDASVNRIVVSLADQSCRAYNGPELVAYSNISSGRSGHETPTGTFTVSQKDIDHHSNLYDDASMPFFMRLTDEGVGLHAGFIPGYPASHGCVRLPMGMARGLFEHTQEGTQVQITDSPMSAMSPSPTTSASVHLAQG